MILDDTGRLIWFQQDAAQRRSRPTSGCRTYRGKPVLTWWQGGLIVGDGRGVGMIYDDRYRRVKTVRAGQRLQHGPARVRDHAATTPR